MCIYFPVAGDTATDDLVDLDHQSAIEDQGG